MVGVIEGPGVTLYYDFGGYGGPPYDHLSRVREHRDGAAPQIWEERTADAWLKVARPMSPEPHPDSVTGVFARFSLTGGPGLAVSGAGLDGDQQATVLAMLRSVALGAQ